MKKMRRRIKVPMQSTIANLVRVKLEDKIMQISTMIYFRSKRARLSLQEVIVKVPIEVAVIKENPLANYLLKVKEQIMQLMDYHSVARKVISSRVRMKGCEPRIGGIILQPCLSH